ncbi:MAG: ATP-binding protein [Victivallales bacterium]|nr:ATP-binding protein [Victivallales bacterium]
MFIGREKEQRRLLQALETDNSEFIAVYGRRRIGKTYLIRETYGKEIVFQHTGLVSGNMKRQLHEFCMSLIDAGYKGKCTAKDWYEAFHLLSSFLSTSRPKKKVVFLDELPWMDTPRSEFVSALDHFWNGWCSARHDIVLVVCGSATSWIIEKIIKNYGGLHNRITRSLLLQPFTLHECELYATAKGLHWNRMQILECYMAMGGVPHYWSFIEHGESAAQAIDRLFFTENGELRNEFGALYASLFRQPEPYLAIVDALSGRNSGLNRKEIARKTGLCENGKFTQMIEALEHCGFIRSYNPIGKKLKDSLLQLVDSFTLFYYRFMKNGRMHGDGAWCNALNSSEYRTWIGLAFEQVCLMHLPQIKKALGISGVNTKASSWFLPGDSEHDGAQIDLLIERQDQIINICEMKFSRTGFSVSKEYERELLRKEELFIQKAKPRQAVHLTLVTTIGLKENLHSNVFQSEVCLDDLFAEA